MATVKDVYRFLDQKAPFDSQLGFDNAGFLVGESNKQVTRILVALDITEEVAREAAEVHADLIVSHHPVIWDGAKSVTDETILGRKLQALITNGIAAICAHTNLDAAKGGVNDSLASALGLTETRLLKAYGVYSDGTPYGIEQVGILPGEPVSLVEFAAAVKDKLGSNGVRYVDAGRP
ncbi:MAG: Nif3-like dinuclear metal center hexameric protein, partial [Oscillospiraceae bacterium]